MSVNVAADTIVNQFINKIADEIKANLRGYGYSENSVRADVRSDTEGIVYGWKWIKLLEQGRGPTSPGAAKGSPTLREAIEAWIDHKGIVAEGITKKSLAYLIAKKIHAEGNKLFRSIRGGAAPQLIFSNVITDDRVEAFIKAYSNSSILYMKSDIINSFKN